MINIYKIPLIIKIIVPFIFLGLSFSPLFPSISRQNNFPDVFSLRLIPLFIGIIFMWLLFTFAIKWKLLASSLAILSLIIFILSQTGIFTGQSFNLINISGNAMSPTYKDGSIWMAKILVQHDRLHRGDVVIFEIPKEPSSESMGRIIAITGDTINIKEGVFSLNGKKINEPYLPEGMKTNNVPNGFHGEGQEKTVTENSVYIMGDHREGSIDSRTWGFVPTENIASIALYCLRNCR